MKELKFLLSSSVLFSVGGYIALGFLKLRTTTIEYKKFMREIMAFSVLMLLVGIAFVSKGLLIDHFQKIKNGNILLMYLTVVVTLLTCVSLIFRIYLKGKEYNKSNLMKLIVIVSIVITFILVYNDNQMTYRIAVVYYSLTCVGFILLMIKRKMFNQSAGVYYIAIASTIVIVANLLHGLLPINLILLVTVALQVLSMLGIMLFYSDYHIKVIDNNLDRITLQNKQLNSLLTETARMAYTDEVTELPNKNALIKDLVNKNDIFSAILFNVRDFHSINRLVGFNRSNDILKLLGKEIDMISEDKDVLYRYYGDHFILIRHNKTLKAELVLYDFIKPISFRNFNGLSVELTAGIVANHRVASAEDISDLFSYLEDTINMAKQLSRPVYEFDFDVYKPNLEKYNLVQSLKGAILDKSFKIYYQPQYCNDTHEIKSYEALIRWQYKGRFVSPSVFIPAAEKEGLIDDITRIVIESVFSNIKKLTWNKEKNISINLSVMQLIDKNFAYHVKGLVNKYDIDPSRIVFEITESALFSDYDQMLYVIKSLKSLGFQLSLDDYGNGYSSIYRFALLNFDEIKFDKVFIKDYHTNDKIPVILKKSIELFKEFNLRVVVEGVETEAQVEEMSKYGVDLLQGFYFSKAKPIKDLIIQERGSEEIQSMASKIN